MALYSLLSEFQKKQNAPAHMRGFSGPGTRSPVLPGFDRASLGSSGARPFQARNPDAGVQKERQSIMSALGVNQAPPLPFTSRKIRAMQRYM